MGFLNPYMLWGMLAVALPVIIHFWNQKKGKQIAWAASQWLSEKTSLKHRGIALDEIPLLLIRCLLVILLALLLSRPRLNWVGQDTQKEEVHLVQADPKVVSNFRFEIEKALNENKKVIWIGAESKPVTDLASIPQHANDLYFLQQAINDVASERTNSNLYFLNNQELIHLPRIFIPGTFTLNTIKDSAQKADDPFANLAQKIGKANVRVLIDYRNPDEAKTVHAGLQALGEVFKIPMQVDFKANPQGQYDWIFTDQAIKKRNPETLYVVREGSIGNSVFENVIEVGDSLRLASSDIVRNGQLPEWLGQMLIEHYNLEKNRNPLSQRQLEAAFSTSKSENEHASNDFQEWLLLFFMLTLMLERWISLNQKATRIHA